MQRSEFTIARMDCAAEESLVRLKLADVAAVRTLAFDLSERRLTVLHDGQLDAIERAIDQLDLDARLVGSGPIDDGEVAEGGGADRDAVQRRMLWSVLAINAALFVVEAVFGLLSGSMGLVADSLDMLADAIVYGLSLLAVGAALARKRTVARISGYLQLSLAALGILEVLRRFLDLDASPDVGTMIVVSLLALLANGASLILLQRSKSREIHMRASTIFTSNDIVINLGVVLAAVLVRWSDSGVPDLIVGGVVFLIVFRGAFRILRLAD